MLRVKYILLESIKMFVVITCKSKRGLKFESLDSAERDSGYEALGILGLSLKVRSAEQLFQILGRSTRTPKLNFLLFGCPTPEYWVSGHYANRIGLTWQGSLSSATASHS